MEWAAKAGCHGRRREDGAAVGLGIIDAVGYGDTEGVGTKVVIVDRSGDRSRLAPEFLKLPTSSRFLVSTLMMGHPRR